MRTIRTTRAARRSGFTIIELMITVGLIGVLAAIAVPNFTSYQARSRRSEAYTNLSALGRAEKAYQAEANTFVESSVGVLAFPDWDAYGGLSAKKPWDADSSGVFDIVGWEPEGQVFYSYEVNAGQVLTASCSCDLCFTASAHSDVDGDGTGSSLMYVHPQRDPSTGVVTGECSSFLFGLSAPLRPGVGTPIYDEVAVNPQNDDY